MAVDRKDHVAGEFPAALTNVSWTCASSGGASCTASGSGDINDRVNIPVGGSVTYIVNAGVLASATGSLVNTASVTAPADVIDTVPTNNSYTDSDRLTPQGCRPADSPIMNTALWIAQILLAIPFLMAGVTQLMRLRVEMAWLAFLKQLGAVGKATEGIRLSAISEILGAVGLILPSLTCILSWLTPLAAAGLALLMVRDIITQVQQRCEYRTIGEYPTIIVMNVVLLALAVFVAVAYGRFVLVSL